MSDLMGRKFQSVRNRTIYTIIGYDVGKRKYQCEFRLMGSMRTQIAYVSRSELLKTSVFKEISWI